MHLRLLSKAATELRRGRIGNALEPLSISPEVRDEVVRLNPVAVRYAVMHDLFHVLLGFDASRAEELAVWSFVAEQRYCPTYERAATAASIFYPLMEPTGLERLRQHKREGVALGRKAAALLYIPFETLWNEPPARLRFDLGIRPQHAA